MDPDSQREEFLKTFDQSHQSVLWLWNDRYSSVFFPQRLSVFLQRNTFVVAEGWDKWILRMSGTHTCRPAPCVGQEGKERHIYGFLGSCQCLLVRGAYDDSDARRSTFEVSTDDDWGPVWFVDHYSSTCIKLSKKGFNFLSVELLWGVGNSSSVAFLSKWSKWLVKWRNKRQPVPCGCINEPTG